MQRTPDLSLSRSLARSLACVCARSISLPPSFRHGVSFRMNTLTLSLSLLSSSLLGCHSDAAARASARQRLQCSLRRVIAPVAVRGSGGGIVLVVVRAEGSKMGRSLGGGLGGGC
jgi:hypothetical protein